MPQRKVHRFGWVQRYEFSLDTSLVGVDDLRAEISTLIVQSYVHLQTTAFTFRPEQILEAHKIDQ